MARRRAFDENEVIDRAMDAFWAHGYRSTTPQMLVDVTGLSKSSLYATFDSKRGLFLAALDRYIDVQLGFMQATLASGSLRQALTTMFEMVTAMLTGDAPRACLMCSAALETPHDDEEVLARLAGGHDALRQLFADRLRRAVHEGELREGTNPDDLAAFLVNTNMGLHVTARVSPQPDTLTRITRQALATIPFA